MINSLYYDKLNTATHPEHNLKLNDKKLDHIINQKVELYI